MKVEVRHLRHGNSIIRSVVRLPCQLVEQRLRLLKVYRVKALGEPVIGLGEQLVSGVALALPMP